MLRWTLVWMWLLLLTRVGLGCVVGLLMALAGVGRVGRVTGLVLLLNMLLTLLRMGGPCLTGLGVRVASSGRVHPDGHVLHHLLPIVLLRLQELLLLK